MVKLSKKFEKLILNVALSPFCSISDEINEMVDDFLNGELDIYDAETGEKLDPKDYASDNLVSNHWKTFIKSWNRDRRV